MTNKINQNFPRGVEVVVGIVIENEKGEILLTKSQKWNNIWVIPGGHVDPGETIFATAIREAKEETNLDCDPIGIFNFGEMINQPDFHRPAHFVFFDVYCKTNGENIKLDKNELFQYKWLSLEKAKEAQTRPDFIDTFDKFIKYKKGLS